MARNTLNGLTNLLNLEQLNRGTPLLLRFRSADEEGRGTDLSWRVGVEVGGCQPWWNLLTHSSESARSSQTPKLKFKSVLL